MASSHSGGKDSKAGATLADAKSPVPNMNDTLHNLGDLKNTLLAILAESVKPPRNNDKEQVTKILEYRQSVEILKLEGMNRDSYFKAIEQIFIDDKEQWTPFIGALYERIHAVNRGDVGTKFEIESLDDQFDKLIAFAATASGLLEADLKRAALVESAGRVSPRTENGIYLKALRDIQIKLVAWKDSANKVSKQCSEESLETVTYALTKDEAEAKKNLNYVIGQIAGLYERRKLDSPAQTIRPLEMFFATIAHKISTTSLYHTIPPAIKALEAKANQSRHSQMMGSGNYGAAMGSRTPPKTSPQMSAAAVSVQSPAAAPTAAALSPEQKELKELIDSCKVLKTFPIDAKNPCQVFLKETLNREIDKIERDHKNAEAHPAEVTKNIISLLKGIVKAKLEVDKKNEPTLGKSDFAKAYIAVIAEAENKNKNLKEIPAAKMAIVGFNDFKQLGSGAKSALPETKMTEAVFKGSIDKYREGIKKSYAAELSESKQSGVGLNHYVIFNKMAEKFLDFLSGYSTSNPEKIKVIGQLMTEFSALSQQTGNPEKCCNDFIAKITTQLPGLKETDEIYKKLSGISQTGTAELDELKKQAGADVSAAALPAPTAAKFK